MKIRITKGDLKSRKRKISYPPSFDLCANLASGIYLLKKSTSKYLQYGKYSYLGSIIWDGKEKVEWTLNSLTLKCAFLLLKIVVGQYHYFVDWLDRIIWKERNRRRNCAILVHSQKNDTCISIFLSSIFMLSEFFHRTEPSNDIDQHKLQEPQKSEYGDKKTGQHIFGLEVRPRTRNGI